MPTNLSIDTDLIERALKVSGERTKKAAVTKALQEFIARRQQKRLLELMGKLEWDAGFDHKAERLTINELRTRLHSRTAVSPRPSPAKAVRAEREAPQPRQRRRPPRAGEVL